MLLEHKNAIVYGGGGSVGGAVARTFVREGAKIFLAGCTLARVKAVAQDRRYAPGDGQHGTVYGVEKRVSPDCGSVGRASVPLDLTSDCSLRTSTPRPVERFH
jgi:NAD(P)-dependent dehydrogenase (short-subunit alcohol dehydrogenase family)